MFKSQRTHEQIILMIQASPESSLPCLPGRYGAATCFLQSQILKEVRNQDLMLVDEMSNFHRARRMDHRRAEKMAPSSKYDNEAVYVWRSLSVEKSHAVRQGIA